MIISDNEIDIPWAKKRSKRLVTNSFPTRVNLMRKKDFSILENNKNIWKNQENAQVLSDICALWHYESYATMSGEK